MTKQIRDIVKIDQELCDGCGLCVPGCAEGAIEIQDGRARLVEDRLCDGLGACLGHCPRGAITVIKRQAEAFEEQAVQKRLKELETPQPRPAKHEMELPGLGCGCPGSAMATFTPAGAGTRAADSDHQPSALSHWPVKIRLIPAHAPFLKGADLLVTADCVPVAFPGLHTELLPGKAVMTGCPKFDDAHDYVLLLADVFRQAGINSVTVVSMEVPCCAGLAAIVSKAINLSGRKVPFQEVIISRQGRILPQDRAASPRTRVSEPLNQPLINP